MLCILVGLAAEFEDLSSAFVDFFGALLLAVKILVVCAMFYIGCNWFQQGAFNLPLGRMRLYAYMFYNLPSRSHSA